MFSFSVVFDSLQKVSVTPLKSFEAFSIRDWLNQWTVRVKGGMNLLSGMWHGLRNDIIMRNLIYRKWRKKKKNSTGKHARVSAALFLAPIWASNRFAGPFITAIKARLKLKHSWYTNTGKSSITRFQYKLKRLFTHVSFPVKRIESTKTCQV